METNHADLMRIALCGENWFEVQHPRVIVILDGTAKDQEDMLNLEWTVWRMYLRYLRLYQLFWVKP